MSQQPHAQRRSPWLQAGTVLFWLLYGATLLAAGGWLISNIRQIDPQHRAVVMRLGAIERVQDSGLLLAWPNPIEQVVMIPSAQQVLSYHVSALLRSDQARAADQRASSYEEDGDALAGSGYLLTGDAGVVQLDLTLSYQISQPRAFVTQAEHVLPALSRLAERSAVAVAASRDLDTILVARPELVSAGSNAAERREQLRGDLVQAINQRLARLQQQGAGLGIEITRVDVQASLPDNAVSAFNAVLTARQQADKRVADAHTAAEKRLQQANQTADSIRQQATARANEEVASASVDTADIIALAKALDNGSDPDMLQRIYRTRMPALLSRADAVTTVTPSAEAHLLLQGGNP